MYVVDEFFTVDTKLFKCIGVLASDSDFCIFPNISYFPFSGVQYQSKEKMSGIKYSSNDICSYMNISPKVSGLYFKKFYF